MSESNFEHNGTPWQWRQRNLPSLTQGRRQILIFSSVWRITSWGRLACHIRKWSLPFHALESIQYPALYVPCRDWGFKDECCPLHRLKSTDLKSTWPFNLENQFKSHPALHRLLSPVIGLTKMNFWDIRPKSVIQHQSSSSSDKSWVLAGRRFSICAATTLPV